jgi:hypothetical protein
MAKRLKDDHTVTEINKTESSDDSDYMSESDNKFFEA